MNTRRRSRAARYLSMRLEAARRPLGVILAVIAAAGVAAWIVGFLAGLLVIWFGSR